MLLFAYYMLRRHTIDIAAVIVERRYADKDIAA